MAPVEFWEGLPLHEDWETWWNLAKGRKIIATYAISNNTLIGKQLWAEKHFPGTKVIFIEDKALLSNSNRWLIDDSRAQVGSFNEFGGTGILVPRPWNS